jgi:hypothetical protein
MTQIGASSVAIRDEETLCARLSAVHFQDGKVAQLQAETGRKFEHHREFLEARITSLFKQIEALQHELSLSQERKSEREVILQSKLDTALRENETLKEENEFLRREKKETVERIEALSRETLQKQIDEDQKVIKDINVRLTLLEHEMGVQNEMAKADRASLQESMILEKDAAVSLEIKKGEACASTFLQQIDDLKREVERITKVAEEAKDSAKMVFHWKEMDALSLHMVHLVKIGADPFGTRPWKGISGHYYPAIAELFRVCHTFLQERIQRPDDMLLGLHDADTAKLEAFDTALYSQMTSLFSSQPLFSMIPTVGEFKKAHGEIASLLAKRKRK